MKHDFGTAFGIKRRIGLLHQPFLLSALINNRGLRVAKKGRCHMQIIPVGNLRNYEAFGWATLADSESSAHYTFAVDL